jgi:hypothetical protein
MNRSRLPFFTVTLGAIRIGTKTCLLLAVILLLVYEMDDYGKLIVPFKERVEADDVEQVLIGLGAPGGKVGQLAEAVRHASRATKLPHELLIALMFTESTFKEDAVSSKKYKGLMQIPQEIPYPDANILVGARILEEKMRIANGDLHAALAMYKGGRLKPLAQKYASQTLGIYARLKTRKKGDTGTDGR